MNRQASKHYYSGPVQSGNCNSPLEQNSEKFVATIMTDNQYHDHIYLKDDNRAALVVVVQ